MKLVKINFAAIFIVLLAIAVLPACKSKKLVQKPAPVDSTKAMAPVSPPAAPAAAPQTQAAPMPVQTPDYNFNNIQFEFNSSVLRTSAFPVLDKAAAAMKADPSVKFNLNGYASIEGTAEHNKILSQDRANSVRVYLINSGVSADNLTATGFGTSNPVANNATEDGRVLNRRVEIHKQ